MLLLKTLTSGRLSKTSIIALILAVLCLILTLQLINNIFGKPSYAQAPTIPPCTYSGNNEGLISGKGFIPGSANLGNNTTTCVLDPQAAYRDFKVPTYDDLENEFYFLSRSASAKRTAPLVPDSAGQLVLGGNNIYRQTSDLTVTSISGSGVQVIFVNNPTTQKANLNITGNIDYADSDPYSGLVFIVSGDINIYSNVTKVNAVLISSGLICTAYDSSTSTCSNGSTITPQLTINGSLISLNKTNLATGQSAVKLVRNLTVNNIPAEIINKQAKFLYILKGGILTKDLIVTQEDSKYTLTPDPGPPPPPPPAPPPTCQKPNPFSISSIIEAVNTCVIGI